MKKEIYTEVIINGSTAEVWRVLTDLEQFAQWNPFIVRSSGTVSEGATITNVMKNGDKEMTFTPVITAVTEGEFFEWRGSGMGGTFVGVHSFRLEKISETVTKLYHSEKFSGLLSGLFLPMLYKGTLASFEAMNAALKKRVEKK